MADTVKDRLLKVIEAECLTVAGFERKVGLSNGYVRALKAVITPKKMAMILETFPRLNRTWLETGDGKMYIEEKRQGKILEIRENEDCEIFAPMDSFILGVPKGGVVTPETEKSALRSVKALYRKEKKQFQARINELEKLLEERKKELADTKQELADVKSDLTAAQKQVTEAQAKVTDLLTKFIEMKLP